MANRLWVLDDKPIQVSFDTKGYSFYEGGTGILGSPVEAHLRLVAARGDQKIEIPSASDLKGRVVIRSPEEALEFVRLLTSPGTHYLFPDIDYVEPAEADGAPAPWAYTEDYARRMNLEPPRVRREGADFIIERNLVDREGGLFRATERVDSDGGYSLIKRVSIDEHSPVAYPLFQ